MKKSICLFLNLKAKSNKKENTNMMMKVSKNLNFCIEKINLTTLIPHFTTSPINTPFTHTSYTLEFCTSSRKKTHTREKKESSS